MNLFVRSQNKELIDGPVDPQTMHQTCRQMCAVNIYTLGYWPTMQAVKYFLKRHQGAIREIKILDIGCGNGEILRKIDYWARRENILLQLTGIDLNRDAIEAAIHATKSESIHFIHGDIFSLQNECSYDVIISSLTFHHLNDSEIIRLMQWMASHARLGWFVSDLCRHALAYYFIKYFTKLGCFNKLICHDAPLSVARGFRRQDWKRLLSSAGLDAKFLKIRWYPNFRYGIRYEKYV